MTHQCQLPIKVFDFFAGCGGASKGFDDAGLESVFAIDNNISAATTFSRNFPNTFINHFPLFDRPHPKTTFLLRKIEEFPVEALEPIVSHYHEYPILFAGCAPCQPFSQQKTKRPEQDDRIGLLDYFRKFVEYYKPDYVFVENVPGIQKVSIEDGGPFDLFVKTLESLKYEKDFGVVFAQNYGVPQKRKRFVLIASKLGKIKLPPKTHGPGTDHVEYSTPQEWMADFLHLEAGEADPNDPNHQAGHLSELNLRRLRATPIGGDRLNWPTELQLACHTNGYRGHTDVYGRVKWGEPSNCLTTKCTNITNGRFAHPEQNRAITPREAACLQTFPRDFIFEGGVAVAGRQIGNAVPVLLAKKFGEHFNQHFSKYIEGQKDV
jgi:DNA (cytosine-5)-methyltransferase 1